MAVADIQSITIPPSAPHTHTVVFLHGRGDNARNFVASLSRSRTSQGQTLADALPSFRWVFPQAPMRRCASSPDTWPQWFDVWNVRDFAEREELQAEGLKEVVPAIEGILASEAGQLGGRWDRVVLAGISMGAATSVHTLFNLDAPSHGGGRLAAFLGFSARCPFVGRTLFEMRRVLSLADVPDHDNVLRNTPMLLEHCVDDPLVLVQNGRLLRDALQEYGAQVEWKEYPAGGHWFNSPAGMDDVVDFIKLHVVGVAA
ncbi:phospholipase/carboxylesterase family protein [Talaromyces proteolyticus]|uniref:Phospholipase/carboxylesterase family protein n=1 Tax=Talaromyces proteolyticus TaxID=1131652 RepID=A0AAD4KUE1_9EURO|nr:phospholipase/carboxylesterase family protein [Talaromyces proteolyticus]KAH8697255.1 phospholipase/carboxylesterase family protein [Talaromyces proteolyticus]